MKFVSTACLLSTVAAVALAAPAFGQTEAPATAPAPAMEAAPAEAAPAAADPAAAAPAPPAADPAAATPAPAATAQVETNAAPGSQEAATASAAAAAASRELPPVLPTSGDGATLTTLLTNICQPVVKGGDIVALTKTYKIKMDRRSGQYIVQLGGKPYQVAILDPGVNKNVCEMRVRYAVGGDQPIIDALNVWRFLHQPQMVLRRNDIGNYEDVQRVTTTWDNWANQMVDGAMFGLVLVQLNKLDGSPSLDAKFDEAIIQYTTRPATRPMLDAGGERTSAEAAAALGSAPAPGVAPSDPAAPAPAPAQPDPAAAPAPAEAQ